MHPANIATCQLITKRSLVFDFCFQIFPSLETISHLSAAHSFLLPPTNCRPSGPSSASSTSSLDCRSPTPYMFNPFQAALQLPLLTGETSMSFFSRILQQQSHLLSFSSPSELTPRSFIKCPICLAAFPNTWLLEQHTILQHSGQPSRRHHSPESGSSNSSREDKPFQCDQCGQSYRYRSAYLKHREQNHRARLPADKLFTCDICGMQFRYLKSFHKHRLNHTLEVLPHANAFVHHRKEQLKHGGQLAAAMRAARAESAADAAGGPSGVVSESQVSSSNEVEPQSTAAAAGASATATAAAKESANESGDSAPSTPTNAAGATNLALTNSEPTNREQTLFNLLRLPPPERQRERQLFACSFCSKTVRSKENLKLHVRKHTGERPFACLFCGRAFGGKSDLTRHVRIHTGERPYHCEMCGKCFARADYLSKHLTTHLHNSHSSRSAAPSD